eukprot:gnl/MRDRNA2_/MRDRNA2_109910_c0_seq1.p1 gnl/MRDRNA2_/MRDRNA2_109910_c0~~gnl/MRDRNA2_/MRDRNA2_109910_c0_seq1.p1  ORF type:complete len:231 (-),score=52.90 gnl/MRDRNA2_/MRDRNA2_109910_c0_seq1:89-781(-)
MAAWFGDACQNMKELHETEGTNQKASQAETATTALQTEAKLEARDKAMSVLMKGIQSGGLNNAIKSVRPEVSAKSDLGNHDEGKGPVVQRKDEVEQNLDRVVQKLDGVADKLELSSTMTNGGMRKWDEVMQKLDGVAQNLESSSTLSNSAAQKLNEVACRLDNVAQKLDSVSTSPTFCFSWCGSLSRFFTSNSAAGQSSQDRKEDIIRSFSDEELLKEIKRRGVKVTLGR